MKIQEGTRLVIREDLSDRDNSINGIVSEMTEYKGCLAFVTSYTNDNDFLINLDNEMWTWEKSMINLDIEEKSNDTITIGNDEYEELLWKAECFDRYDRDFGNMTR